MYSMTLSVLDRVREAFHAGTLRVHSVSPEGAVEWKRILAVHRAEVGPESIWEAMTEQGPMVLTGGHRVFTSPTSKMDMETLTPGQRVLGVTGDDVTNPEVTSMRRLPDRKHMYDLTAEDWHNFALHRSGVVVSNSPDRNYRFRPPTGEGTVNCFNQVFGYIWEDEEFLQYLEIALWKWNSHPPETEELCSVDQLCRAKPAWKAALLWGALVNAAQALAYNNVADEFGYSIGGVSLDLERSSKYMDLKRNAEEQWDKLTAAKQQTTMFLRGLKQPKFGMGIRSSLGPHTGRGTISPRAFI